MSWEIRGKHRYYYRTYRVDGNLRREYLGRTASAIVAAAADKHRRAQQAAERAAFRRARAALEPLLADCSQVFTEGQALIRQALEAAGYHRPNFGPWRKQRMTGQQKPKPEPSSVDMTHQATDEVPHEALQRASQGERSAMPDVSKYFDNFPRAWQKYGNLTNRVLEKLISQLTGTDLVQREAILRQVIQMRAELARQATTAMGMLLIDRISILWLQVHFVDLAIATPHGDYKFAEYLLKKQHLANRQYLAAMREFALIQRILPASESVPAAIPAPIQSVDEWPHDGPILTVVERPEPDHAVEQPSVTEPPVSHVVPQQKKPRRSKGSSGLTFRTKSVSDLDPGDELVFGVNLSEHRAG